MNLSNVSFPIHKIQDDHVNSVLDQLAVEEPLEIRVGYVDSFGNRIRKSISITMRTPGNDFDLAMGFLYTEGLIRGAASIDEIKHCGPILNKAKTQNIVVIELKSDVQFDFSRLERHFYTSSSCGVCGKTSIDALKIQNPFSPRESSDIVRSGPYFNKKDIHRIPEVLRESQAIFDFTGGLHASALFSPDARLILTREDVGRHNALDKVIGHALKQEMLPLSQSMLMVSGRASFELVQKASMAGIPLLAAVGAPSSLAVELAAEVGMTLLGFVRNNRFNIYHGEWRILP